MIDAPEKQCARCKDEWPAEPEFFPVRSDNGKLSGWCKACHVERAIELRHKGVPLYFANGINANASRINCIGPGCRRTASKEKYPDSGEIVCGDCWRLRVPPRLRNRYKMLNRHMRRARKKIYPDGRELRRIDMLHRMNWGKIREELVAPRKPAGLDQFLDEMMP